MKLKKLKSSKVILIIFFLLNLSSVIAQQTEENTVDFSLNNQINGISKDQNVYSNRSFSSIDVGYNDQQNYIGRGYMEFDISSIPHNAEITDVSLGIYCNGFLNSGNNNSATLLIRNLDGRPDFNNVSSSLWTLIGGSSTFESLTVSPNSYTTIEKQELVDKVQAIIEDNDNYLFFGLRSSNESSTGFMLSDSDLTLTITYETVIDAPPSTPNNLSASNVSSNGLNLNWSGVSGPVNGYNIYQNGIKIKNVSSTSTVISNLNPNTLYTYRVSAFNDIGESPKSSAISVTTKNIAPSAPMWNMPSNITYNSVTLNWRAPSGVVDGYKVYVDGSVVNGAGTTAETYNVENLNSGQTYSFQISAFNNGGESLKNQPMTIKIGTKLPPPSYITIITPSPSVGHVLMWSDVEGATGYKINVVSGGSGTFYTTEGSWWIKQYMDLEEDRVYIFCVSATNSYGSSESICDGLYIYPNTQSKSLESNVGEELNLSELSFYPNPVSNTLNVNSTVDLDIEILDKMGNILIKDKASSKGVDVSHLPNGIYLVNIHLNGEVIQRKIVKE